MSGAITLTFRRWDKPHVRAGGRYRCHPIGVLEVDAIMRVRAAAITDEDARRAGFASVPELRAYLEELGPLGDDDELWRVELHHGGDGDRVELALADTLSGEIHDVLTTTRGDILTVGAVLAVYFASNGVEAVRVALNRAYSVVEPRAWYWLRLESIGYTLVAAFTSLAMAFLIVLGPLILETARRHIPFFVENNESFLFFVRYGITITAMTVALFILHVWLPAGRRRFLQILPGILFTMVASLISGIVFGQYLARFASNYVTMYAGLASVIIALVFLYFIAAIFVYGGELNAAIMKSQSQHDLSRHAAQSLKRAETQA